MTADEIRALFTRRREAWARRDSVALAADFAENCVLESPAFGKLFGRTAVEKSYRQMFATFPDASLQAAEPVISGDQAAVPMTLFGTDTGGFLGQSPTGRQFRFFMVALFVLDDQGRITHERRVYDVNGLLLQLATDRGVVAETSQVYRATLDRVRQEHDLTIAAEVQRALLPERQHTGTGFDIAAASIPCRAIGGDFFDYFHFPSGAFGFAFGDVAGKGPPAALLAAQLQGILATQSYSEGTPSETLARANQVLMRRAVEARFATVLYGVFSRDGRVTYCNAGHNPPFLVGRRGVRRLETGGLILGAFREASYEDEAVSLQPDDLLVVFSDGVTEARNAAGAEFGEERLLACVKANRGLTPAALLEYLFATVDEFTVGAEPFDDRTGLVLRYNGV
jgi:serine phosphatase RsbU (regulator of sigma subunit)